MKISFWETIKNDSQLTIKKLVLTANFLAIALLVGYLSRFIPALVTFPSFLKLSLSDVFIIIALPFLGLIYTYALVFLLPWLLMLIGGSSGPIAYFALFLATASFYTFYLIVMLLGIMIFRFKKTNSLNKFNLKWIILSIWIISAFVAAILTSFLMTFLNWAFLLDWYRAPAYKEKILQIFLPFNLIKFLLQAFVYALLIPAMWPLIIKYVPVSYYNPL